MDKRLCDKGRHTACLYGREQGEITLIGNKNDMLACVGITYVVNQ